jgi:hypothetical protein
MRDAIHSLAPKLRVSPLALSPRALRFDVVISMDDREGVTEKRLLAHCCMLHMKWKTQVPP